jgi:hypothetical protein
VLLQLKTDAVALQPRIPEVFVSLVLSDLNSIPSSSFMTSVISAVPVVLPSHSSNFSLPLFSDSACPYVRLVFLYSVPETPLNYSSLQTRGLLFIVYDIP